MRPPTFEETIEALENGCLTQWPMDVQTKALLEITPFGDQPLEHAFENNLLSSINHLLTEDWLTTLNEDGFAPIHFLGEYGLLHKIPKRLLTERVLTAPSITKNTAIHEAAFSNQLDVLPQPLLTEKTFHLENIEGFTPLHCAAETGFLPKVPIPIPQNTLKKLLKSPRSSRLSKLWIATELLSKPHPNPQDVRAAIQTGTFFKWDPETIEEAVLTPSPNGLNALHWAAQKGLLKNIPKGLLTEENLKIKDPEGMTPLHHAARERKIPDFPTDLISKTLISLPNPTNGKTPLHEVTEFTLEDLVYDFLYTERLKSVFAIPKDVLTAKAFRETDYSDNTALNNVLQNFLADAFELLPKSLITQKDLLSKDPSTGANGFHRAAAAGLLHLFPKPLYSRKNFKNLLTEDSKGKTPIDYACSNETLHAIPVPLPTPVLTRLLKKSDISEKSRKWIESALLKRELQNCDHPDL